MKVEPYQPVVIDTNVWLSAAITRNGTAALLCGLLFERHCQPAFSQSTFDELASRLFLSKFDRFLGMDSRLRFIANARDSAHWCNLPVPLAAQIGCRDLDDDKFIALALAVQATRLITGDEDLLCIDPLGELRILTPR
jgi:putative PIN family toxin of toxin-antitoxin system